MISERKSSSIIESSTHPVIDKVNRKRRRRAIAAAAAAVSVRRFFVFLVTFDAAAITGAWLLQRRESFPLLGMVSAITTGNCLRRRDFNWFFCIGRRTCTIHNVVTGKRLFRGIVKLGECRYPFNIKDIIDDIVF